MSFMCTVQNTLFSILTTSNKLSLVLCIVTNRLINNNILIHSFEFLELIYIIHISKNSNVYHVFIGLCISSIYTKTTIFELHIFRARIFKLSIKFRFLQKLRINRKTCKQSKFKLGDETVLR